MLAMQHFFAGYFLSPFLSVAVYLVFCRIAAASILLMQYWSNGSCVVIAGSSASCFAEKAIEKNITGLDPT